MARKDHKQISKDRNEDKKNEDRFGEKNFDNRRKTSRRTKGNGHCVRKKRKNKLMVFTG